MSVGDWAGHPHMLCAKHTMQIMVRFGVPPPLWPPLGLRMEMLPNMPTFKQPRSNTWDFILPCF